MLPAALARSDPEERLVAALAGYLEAVQADPQTWRLVLVPHEGAPARAARGDLARPRRRRRAARRRARRRPASTRPTPSRRPPAVGARRRGGAAAARGPGALPARARPRARPLVPRLARARGSARCDLRTRGCARTVIPARRRGKMARRGGVPRAPSALGDRDLVLTAFFAYGIIRLLRPDRYPAGESVLGGTWRDVDDALFGFTLGEDYVHEEFVRGFAADLYLLAGGLVVAVGLGLAGGIWCAVRDRIAVRAWGRGRGGVLPLHARLCPRARDAAAVRAAVRARAGPVSSTPTPTRRRWSPRGTSSARWSCRGWSSARRSPARSCASRSRSRATRWASLGAHRARQGPVTRSGRAAPRRAGLVRDGAVAVRRVGADHGHERRPGRVGVLDPGLLPPHAARARAELRRAPELHRTPMLRAWRWRRRR